MKDSKSVRRMVGSSECYDTCAIDTIRQQRVLTSLSMHESDTMADFTSRKGI